MKELFLKEMKFYSADDADERVALIDLNGTKYVIAFSLIKYKNNWFINGFILIMQIMPDQL